MRNTRTVKDWSDDLVVAAEVAPHRYTWGRDDAAEDAAKTGLDFVEAQPYAAGDVVYVERLVAAGRVARKARIVRVGYEFDRWGDRRAVFQVQLETGAGRWAKLWTRAYPGQIQRGYQRAGLAPDLDALDARNMSS